MLHQPLDKVYCLLCIYVPLLIGYSSLLLQLIYSSLFHPYLISLSLHFFFLFFFLIKTFFYSLIVLFPTLKHQLPLIYSHVLLIISLKFLNLISFFRPHFFLQILQYLLTCFSTRFNSGIMVSVFNE